MGRMGNRRDKRARRLYPAGPCEDSIFMERADAGLYVQGLGRKTVARPQLCLYNIGDSRNICYRRSSVSDREILKQKGIKVGGRRAGIDIFIERSLKGALSFFKEAVFSDDIARSGGLLQSIDPRLKTVFLLVLLVVTCFARAILWIAMLYILSIILAVSSRIKVLFFIKRVWFFIPLFALLIAIPAVFMYGIFSACIFVLRVATCVSFAVLFTVTTRHSDLLRSLRWLRIPSIYVQVLDMTYRYIFLFIKVFEEMHLSLKARLVRHMGPAKARHWVASRIAFLFKRSVKMSEEVYMAMLARGYTGEIKRYGR